MKSVLKNVFTKFAVVSLTLSSVLVSVPNFAHAAANITIATAKIVSASTLEVTFNDPGATIASVDATKWHIDQNTGGTSPLTPASAAITVAGTPWKITLTFSGTPFSNTGTSFDASHGLYADASAVGDGTDTNTVIVDSASIAIADAQAPTVVSVSPASAATNVNRGQNVVITFSEPMTTGSLAFSTSPVGVYVAGWSVGNTVVTLTHSADWSASATQTDTIATGTTDAATTPVHLAAPYVWSFTTRAGSSNSSSGSVINEGTFSFADDSSSTSSTSTTTNGTTTTTTTTTTAPTTPVVSCPTGAVYDTATGAACTAWATSTTVTCAAGVMYDTTTGAKCTAWTGAANPGTSTYAFGTVLVKLGTTGDACKAWQSFFNAHGSNLIVDGSCGPLTIAAAKSWQASAGLTADGLLGAMSRAKASVQ